MPAPVAGGFLLCRRQALGPGRQADIAHLPDQQLQAHDHAGHQPHHHDQSRHGEGGGGAEEAANIAAKGECRAYAHEASAYQPLQQFPGWRHAYLELAGEQGGGQGAADDAEIQYRGGIQVRGNDFPVRDADGVEKPISPVAHTVSGAPGLVEGKQEDVDSAEQHAADPYRPLLAEYLRVAIGERGPHRFGRLLST